MPWEVRTVKEAHKAFAGAVKQGEESFSALCRVRGISRKTGYKWYKCAGADEPLHNGSRKPHNSPRKTSPAMEAQILTARQEHPAWEPRKLKRNGCVDTMQSPKNTPYRCFERDQSNELWQMDFKGHFPLENGTRCHPLTVLDDHSCYALCLQAMPNERREGCHPL